MVNVPTILFPTRLSTPQHSVEGSGGNAVTVEAQSPAGTFTFESRGGPQHTLYCSLPVHLYTINS